MLKCRTCGYTLTRDLNGDFICLHGLIDEKNHDDYYPRDWMKIFIKDYDFLISHYTGMDKQDDIDFKKIKDRYKNED